MRKMLIVAAAAAAVIGGTVGALHGLAGGAGRSAEASAEDGVIVVGDRLFAAKLQDMAINMKSYAGKAVRMEGYTLTLRKDLPWRFAVARDYTCCGPDGYPVGLPCQYGEDTPAENAWIEVEGTLRADDNNLPYVEVFKLTVKDTPGRRSVSS